MAISKYLNHFIMKKILMVMFPQILQVFTFS